MTATHALFSRHQSIAGAEEDRHLAETCLGAEAHRGSVLSLDEMSAPDAVFRWPGEVATGAGAAMANALADLAAFPGAAIVVEDVLATPTPHNAADPGAGTYHSARGVLLGRHDGPGLCGSPTGRPVEMRRMTDYWAFGGRLHDVWIVDDTAGLLSQTGAGTPREVAAGRLAAVAGREAGSGFGLAICQQIARRHGGLVTYQPLPGGSRFRVHLPLAASTAREPA